MSVMSESSLLKPFPREKFSLVTQSNFYVLQWDNVKLRNVFILVVICLEVVSTDLQHWNSTANQQLYKKCVRTILTQNDTFEFIFDLRSRPKAGSGSLSAHVFCLFRGNPMLSIPITPRCTSQNWACNTVVVLQLFRTSNVIVPLWVAAHL